MCTTFISIKRHFVSQTPGKSEVPSFLIYCYWLFTAQKLLPTWDKKIEALCYHVNHIIELMSADTETREWMNKHLNDQMTL